MENRKFWRKTVASSQSFSYHARAENAIYRSFCSMLISHSLLYWVTVRSSTPVILESCLTLAELADAIIIDKLTQLWWTVCAHEPQTFEEYAGLDVLLSIQGYSTMYQRTNIVLDVYHWKLEVETRSKRGRGARRRFTSNGKFLERKW